MLFVQAFFIEKYSSAHRISSSLFLRDMKAHAARIGSATQRFCSRT
jgi:hypothetical protein